MADVQQNLNEKSFHVQIPQEDSRHTEHFRLQPFKAFLPVAQGSSEQPAKHTPYKVHNFGLSDLKVDLIYGTKTKIEGVAQTAVIKPDEEITLNPGDKLYEHTALKVYNKTNDQANFSVEGGNLVFGADELAEDLPHA